MGLLSQVGAILVGASGRRVRGYVLRRARLADQPAQVSPSPLGGVRDVLAPADARELRSQLVGEVVRMQR
eukprot:7003827-Pyramimonas_sp.AAC.1